MVVAEVLFWFSFLAVVYAYLGYPLLLACCHFFCRRNASQPDDEYCPTVSIVLAAHNEAMHIRRKLENCLALDYPRENLQILVGSDGSDDGTDRIAEQFLDRGVEFLSFKTRRGKMATVNRLVRHAKGEVCMFSDISEQFEPDAVRKLVRHLADSEIGAVTGNHIYYPAGTGIGRGTSFYWNFQRFLQGIESRLHSVCACDGTIYACRREWFPFPEDDTINDDVAVPLGILQRGKRVILAADAIARGEVLSSVRRFLTQKIRGQAGKYQIFARYWQMFLPWPLRRWWVFASHSALPVLVPWFLATALISNAALWFSGDPLYQWLLVLQAGFYIVALAGAVAEKLHVRLRLTSVPFYFVLANLGSACGFFAFVFKLQRPAWRKVD